jgi:hypothetical protein
MYLALIWAALLLIVSSNGEMDIYSRGYEIIVDGKILQERTKEFESLGFGNILIQRMIEFCQDNGIEKLSGKDIHPRNQEDFQKRKSYFESNGFTITDGGAGRASLIINPKKL